MYAISESSTDYERSFSYDFTFNFNITFISVITNNLYVILGDQ